MPREKWKLTQAAIDADAQVDPWGEEIGVWGDTWPISVVPPEPAPFSTLDVVFGHLGSEDGVVKVRDGMYRVPGGWL